MKMERSLLCPPSAVSRSGTGAASVPYGHALIIREEGVGVKP